MNEDFQGHMELTLPIRSTFGKRKSSNITEDSTPTRKQYCQSKSFDKSPSSRKSSFSKKSKQSRGINDEDHSAQDACFTNAYGSLRKQELLFREETFMSKFRDDFDRIKYYEDTAIKILNELPISKITNPTGFEEFARKYKKTSHHKRTVFLDLDDTLIYVSLYKLGTEDQKEITITNENGHLLKMYLYLRPGMIQFLDRLKQNFELILFNNGSTDFTQTILEQIKQDSECTNFDYFSYILSKDQCALNDAGQEIKNLEFFCGEESGRNIKDVILVDNNMLCFSKQITNGILLPKFEGQLDDNWLELLADYLISQFSNQEQLTGQDTGITDQSTDDIRKIISQDFEYERIILSTRTSQIRQMMTKNISVTSFMDEPEEENKDDVPIRRNKTNINSPVNKPISQLDDKTYQQLYLNFMKD